MPIRVMLVDDSAIVRGLIARAIEADPGIEVVATASNGRIGVQQAGVHKPDIVILDIEMPEMDGITALPEILKSAPGCKVIMASTLTLRNAGISLQALSLGASDYLAKPSSTKGKEELDLFYHELIAKIRALVPHKGTPRASAAPAVPATPVRAVPVQLATAVSTRPQALAIASSTGGPQALTTLMEGLKGSLGNVPIFLTQHMPPTFTTILAEQLSKTGGRPCAEAKEGEIVKHGHMYVAPGNYHMLAVRKGVNVELRLNQDPPVNYCRPAADPMLNSLSQVYGNSLFTVVLTGMGQDGMEGARTASKNGGGVIAQDEATSVVYGMPKAVAEAGVCQAILPLPEIAGYILQRFR